MLVVGGGIVGLSAALYLRRDGRQVTLIDRSGPGGAASFGNAGAVTVSGCAPLGMPGMLWRVPRMLLNPQGPLVVRWRYLLRIAPWLVQFLRASHHVQVERIARALASSLRGAAEAWRDLASQCGGTGLLLPRGWLRIFSTEAGYVGSQRARELMARNGLAFDVLDAKTLRDFEPALSSIFRYGIYQPGGLFIANPGRMLELLAAEFVARGGRYRRQNVVSLDIAPGVCAAITENGRETASAVVVAAGAWSGRFARQLGARVRLDTERGYHLMLPPLEPGLRNPTVWDEQGFVLAPMEHGVRLTSGIEFAGLGAPPDFRRIRGLLSQAKRMLPGLEPHELSSWLGFRPSIPDSLPVIDRSPHYPNALLAFGHGHLGLTLGPTTGQAIADLLADRQPRFDLRPFAADRG